MQALINIKNKVDGFVNPAADWVALLPIRLLMGYEFAKAGMTKFGAADRFYGYVPDWFANTSDKFPFPFHLFSNEFNFFAVTWIELIGGIALFFGLFTRFWAFSLGIVTIVAIFGVHWPDEWNSLSELWQGYSISNKGFGNFRLPLLFLAMLIALMFRGGGKLSLDNLVVSRFFGK